MKLQALGTGIRDRKRLAYKCFPVNLAKVLKASFLQNNWCSCEQLLLRNENQI